MGASNHFTNNKDKIVDLKPCKGVVSTAGKESLKIKGRGHLNDIGGVTWIPDINKNLLSVVQFTKDPEVTVLFSGNECIVKKGSKIITKAKRGPDQLYRTYLVHAESKVFEWHYKFGHVSLSGLKHLVRMKKIDIPSKELELPLKCAICAQGKATRMKYIKQSKCLNTKPRSSKPGELVYSDICGPMSVESYDGYRYYQVFVDDYTCVVVTSLLKSKSDAFSNIKTFVKYMSQRGTPIISLRTDQGTEFVNNKVEDFLRLNCIQHQLTGRSASLQNHVAERMNRTLTEMARTMLVHAGLPKIWWGHAIKYDTVIYGGVRGGLFFFFCPVAFLLSPIE